MAFSWTCHPNRNDVSAQRIIVSRNVLLEQWRNNRIKLGYVNKKNIEYTSKPPIITIIKINVKTKVIVGVIEGNTWCSISCTRPDVIDADTERAWNKWVYRPKDSLYQYLFNFSCKNSF